ncbi:DUF6585 family protein [Actinomadura livida]|uniref:Uncharacterized protein n=1 Tax=Actinomadura livida TaxID=79909 RepID=A0A7W7I9J6_9ACTN|nr:MULTISPECIES: DUF6585 family protein [Actinomadura]MBB4772933.1 hypothetical protein [Actinomadura catellatispora]GGU13760.1 hypothetical protein GCM10010208_43510 [Actinomadura livida]
MADSQGRLGEPVRTFDGRAGDRRTWAWSLLLSLTSLALIPAAVVYLRDGVWWAGAPALLLSMGSAAGVGWIAGRDRPRARDRVVRLHTGGISVTGPGDAGYAWDELVSVTVSGVRSAPDERTRWRFTIVADDGTVLRLTDDLPDVRALGLAVAKEVTARIVPRHLAAVKAGEAVRLAPFTVDLGGVEKDGERLPWAAVGDVAIGNGMVVVHACGGRGDLMTVASQMPDALAFMALCQQVRELARDF